MRYESNNKNKKKRILLDFDESYLEVKHPIGKCVDNMS